MTSIKYENTQLAATLLIIGCIFLAVGKLSEESVLPASTHYTTHDLPPTNHSLPHPHTPPHTPTTFTSSLQAVHSLALLSLFSGAARGPVAPVTFCSILCSTVAHTQREALLSESVQQMEKHTWRHILVYVDWVLSKTLLRW